eukprot:Pgem_evm1s1180
MTVKVRAVVIPYTEDCQLFLQNDTQNNTKKLLRFPTFNFVLNNNNNDKITKEEQAVSELIKTNWCEYAEKLKLQKNNNVNEVNEKSTQGFENDNVETSCKIKFVTTYPQKRVDNVNTFDNTIDAVFSLLCTNEELSQLTTSEITII